MVGVDEGNVISFKLLGLLSPLLLEAPLLLLHLVPHLGTQTLETGDQLLLPTPFSRLLLHTAQAETHVTRVAVIPERRDRLVK